MTNVLLFFAAAALQVNHPPIACMVEDKFPQIEAVIEPAADVSEARIYFRSAQEQVFHYVPMGLQLGRFVGKMPKPQSDASPVTYYVEAVSGDGASRRTPPLAAMVVDKPSECPKGGRISEIARDGNVLVFSTGDSTSKPDGFSGVSDVKRGLSPVRTADARPAPAPPVGASASPSPASRLDPRAEEKRRAEDKRAAERKQEEDEKKARVEEQKRQADRKRAEEQRKADDKRVEEQKKADESQRAEEQKKADESKRAAARTATPSSGASPRASATSPTVAQVPAAQATTRAQAAAAASVLPGSDPSAAPSALDYQIGPQDVLKITVFGHDDLTQVVVVQADGTFAYPLLGQIKAADFTPRDMGKKISYLLSQGFVRNPQVSVTVQEYHSKNVFVLGEVLKPGAYPLQASGSNSLVEAISKAGPMTANAGQEVLVIRPRDRAAQGPTLLSDVTGADPKRQADVIRVNLSEIQQGRLDKNIELYPDDTVYVPQATKVFVSGEVRNPGAYAFTAGTTVRQAISLAGGFTDRASPNRVRLVRDGGDGKAREDKVKLEDVVQPGDTILVKEKLF